MELGNNRKFFTKIVKNISQYYLQLDVKLDKFMNIFSKIIQDSISSLFYFEKWSNSKDIEPFVAIIFEWESNYSNEMSNKTIMLNPEEWID